MNLHVFDMDGTLMQGSACLEISRVAGVLDETLVIEEHWLQGEISDTGFWHRCLPLWSGISEAQIDKAFCESPWLEGVATVLADIKQRREVSVVISQSPEWFVQRLKRWGLQQAHGAGVTPGDRPGSVRLVSSDDKLQITRALLNTLQLDISDCVAYGDSSSDLALFKNLPNTVGVNAKSNISELATKNYIGNNFFDAYAIGRMLLRTNMNAEKQP